MLKLHQRLDIAAQITMEAGSSEDILEVINLTCESVGCDRITRKNTLRSDSS